MPAPDVIQVKVVPPLPRTLKAACSMWLEIPGRCQQWWVAFSRCPLGTFPITALLPQVVSSCQLSIACSPGPQHSHFSVQCIIWFLSDQMAQIGFIQVFHPNMHGCLYLYLLLYGWGNDK